VIDIESAIFGRGNAKKCTGYTYDNCYNFDLRTTDLVQQRQAVQNLLLTV
jgi:hypothetical protein